MLSRRGPIWPYEGLLQHYSSSELLFLMLDKIVLFTLLYTNAGISIPDIVGTAFISGLPTKRIAKGLHSIRAPRPSAVTT